MQSPYEGQEASVGPRASVWINDTNDLLADCTGTVFSRDEETAHAERLVACWNACRGISNEALNCSGAFCPHCGSRDTHDQAPDWEARSLDSCDRNNVATLQEHQCNSCHKSFWK